MGVYREQARAVLMDAAEELFATHGIDAVSGRRIAEHTNNANHSAVSYHFGSRDGLLRAIVARQAERTDSRRCELMDRLGDAPDLHDLMGCLIVPLTDQFAAVEGASWHARFIRQLRATPSSMEVLKDSAVGDTAVADLLEKVRELLSDIPVVVLTTRFWMLGLMVIDVCAEYETKLQNEPDVEADWTSVARSLVDACVGTLGAEVTSEAELLGGRRAALWL